MSRGQVQTKFLIYRACMHMRFKLGPGFWRGKSAPARALASANWLPRSFPALDHYNVLKKRAREECIQKSMEMISVNIVLVVLNKT